MTLPNEIVFWVNLVGKVGTIFLWHWCGTFLPLFDNIAKCKGIWGGFGGQVMDPYLVALVWHFSASFS